MEAKTKNGLIAVAVVALIGVVIYKVMQPKKIVTKEQMADYLVANKATVSKAGLMTFGYDFVKAWHDSMVAQKNDLNGRFIFEGSWHFNNGGATVMTR